MPLRLVTDSSCDLPEDLIKSLGVIVVPCNIHFGTEVFRDVIDMKPEEFYERLAGGGIAPTTSQPSVESFVAAYEKARSGADEILSIHISNKLSSTVDAARLAVQEVKGAPITVLDSLQTSLGLGFQVMEAARMAKAGSSARQVRQHLEQENKNIISYVMVDTLEFLVRGGRASKLQGFFGSLLNIKPIVAVKDNGEVHPFDRVRTRRKAVDRLIELAASTHKPHYLGVIHSVAPEEALTLVESCSKHFPKDQIVLAQFSAVLGSHVGPQALGLSVWAS